MKSHDMDGAFSDVVSSFAASKGALIDPNTDNTVQNKEVLRKAIVDRYATAIYLPRLDFWQTFDAFFKSKCPTSVNPYILNPIKPSLGGSDHQENIYYKQLDVAKWQFEKTLPNQQLKVATTVSGLEVNDGVQKSLMKDYPKTGLGKLALGKRNPLREAYLAKRIQAINGYTIETQIHNLEGDGSKIIRFNGPSEDYDTFVTLDHLHEAERTFTAVQSDTNGQGFRTRPAGFRGVFSAPIKTPIELSQESFIPKYVPGESGSSIDVEGSYRNYTYLFDGSASAQFYGRIDTNDGNELFKPYGGGNETLAYLQAAALFSYIEDSALVDAAS